MRSFLHLPLFRRWLGCGFLAWLMLVPVAALPINYQGRLVDGNALANGNYELRFRLFDQLAGGTQVGAVLSLPTVTVTNGLFTVQLDFGPGAFNGAARWVEVAARPAGSAEALGVFDPRQPVTAVPYALYALSGSGDAAALITGTLPDARLSGNVARMASLLTVSNALAASLQATNAAMQSQVSQLAVRLDQLTTALQGTSNKLRTDLQATNVALQAQVTQLSAALLSVSNQFQASLPPGITAASTDPADATLLAKGLARFSMIDAPGWRSASTDGAPTPRSAHSAAWTGQSMLIWGGALNGGTVSATGASYDVSLDVWTPISPLDAPDPRRGHSVVWTGQSMIVWGGFGAGYLGDGAEYSPTTLGWLPLTVQNAPTAREGQGTAWTGSRMFIWGGRNGGGLLNDGGIYNPASKQWSALPTAGAPEARSEPTTSWTGTQLIVWGGRGTGGELNTGARLAIAGGTTPGAWTVMAAAGAPGTRVGHSAVWTGQKLIFWGGRRSGVPLRDGASYDPANNTWQSLPDTDAPAARSGHVAVWTGEEMLIFGGEGAAGEALATGAAFKPATGKWRTLSGTGSPLARSEGTGVWSGSELLVFGGQGSGGPVSSLQRLNPQPTWYFYRKP